MMMSLNPRPIVVGHSVHLCLHPLHRHLEQLLASQNVIMHRLAKIGEHQAGHSQQHQQPQDSSYLNFLPTQPPMFTKTTYPLEANHWIRVTDSKFRLLHCTVYQKTLYTAQQLKGSAGAWCASYTAAIPKDHHVPWGEFRTTFHSHHLLTGLLYSKLKNY
jgi:hypothetical protein